MGKNIYLDCSQILYNLAFSPKIRHIDMTDNLSSNNAETAESLYKLIKISGSIQNLLFGGTNIGLTLTSEFYKALGENKTLEHLNLDIRVGTTSTLT